MAGADAEVDPGGSKGLADPRDLRRDRLEQRLFPSLSREPLHLGRFVLLSRVGAGGMGDVYAAYDEQLDRRVAIKLLRTDASERSRARDRLLREAKALARLSHPNVVQIHEAGVLDGQVFIAMEFVDAGTLGQWLREHAPPVGDPRRWPFVVERFVEAGRGLAAAHAHGLVHRDFKPDNVLVGRDGRVRVVDFGLARPVGQEPPSDEGETICEPGRGASSSGSGSRQALASLTNTGAILGTIAYMAPEQMRGCPVDARCDQFSFCVALYEALYGVRPYDGRTLAARAIAIDHGKLVEPEAVASAPRWLYRVLLRGLAREPEQRFADMDALLAALARPAARRRWTIGVLLLASTTLAAGGALAWRPAPCVIDRSALAGTWDDERREAVRTAFSATGLSFADESFTAAERTLDGWSDGWVAAQREACEATRVAGVQSEASLDQRTACLERKRYELDTLVDLLSRAEPALVTDLGGVLSELPDLVACEDPRTAAERFPLPEEPARTEILASLGRISEARTLARVGMIDEARAIHEEIEPRARELDHPPLTLELAALDAVLRLADHRYDEGTAALLAVVREAEVLELDELVATLRVELAGLVVGVWSKPELEDLLIADADVALRRLRRERDPREVRLLVARGYAQRARGEFRGALVELERAYELARELELLDADWLRVMMASARIELGDHDRAEADLAAARAAAEALWGPRSPAVARVEHELAMLETSRERFAEARTHLDVSLAITEPLYGPDAIAVARSRFLAVKLAMYEGELTEALAIIEPLIEVYERALGPDHFELAGCHNAAGVLRFFAGNFQGSLDSYERALTISVRVLGEDHPETALLHSNIGESLAALGRHAQALAAFERALTTFGRVLSAGDPMLALPLKGRGQVHLSLGEPTKARDDLERALAIAEASRGEPIERAEIRAALARALDASGGDPGRSRALAEQARTELRALGFEERARAIDAWLADR